jgi:hypothetical protein
MAIDQNKRPRESDEWRHNFATKLLAQDVLDNDKRYADDVYGRVSLKRYRELSLPDLQKANDELHEQQRRALLKKMSYTSSYALLGYIGIVAYLLAVTGIVGGILSQEPSGVLIGVASLTYAVWFYRYEKRLIALRDYRAKEIEVIKWVQIEKGDEVTTRFAGLPAMPSEWIKPS